MLHYRHNEGSTPSLNTMQVYTDKTLSLHICGYWNHSYPDPENPWVVLFPSSGKYFYFKDEDTLKTFLELHWQEYRT